MKSYFALVISKDSEPDHFDSRHASNINHSLSTTPTTRRTTRSTASLLSRMAQSSNSENTFSSPNCSSSSMTESSSELCSSSSTQISSTPKRCSCTCHQQDNAESEIHLEQQQSHSKYAKIAPLATFHAHKAILMARSSSFAAQIRASIHYSHGHLNLPIGSNFHSKLPSIDLYVDDLEPASVRAMLTYIYTGRLHNSNDEIKSNLNPIDLFRAAVKYDLHELRQLAKSTMLDVLKIDNAIEMLEVSDQANDQILKQQVLTYIRSNAAAVSKTTNWLQFTKHHPQLIIDAFRSLVTPLTTSSSSSTTTTTTTNAKHNTNNSLTYHSTSLTTTSKQYSKYD